MFKRLGYFVCERPVDAIEFCIYLFALLCGYYVFVETPIGRDLSSLVLGDRGLEILNAAFFLTGLVGMVTICMRDRWPLSIRVRQSVTFTLFFLFLYSTVIRLQAFTVASTGWGFTIILCMISMVCYMHLKWIDPDTGKPRRDTIKHD